MEEKIMKIIADQFMMDPAEITREKDLVNDLGADSLDVVDLTMTLEEEFALPETSDEEILKIHTVGDLVDYVSRASGNA